MKKISKILYESKKMDRMNVLYIFSAVTLGGATQSLVDTLIVVKNQINPIVVIREDVMA